MKFEDVKYASISASEAMDIYLPEEEKIFPVIVLIHGGAFAFGDQKMNLMQLVIKYALKQGYAVASIDYRKSSEKVFPASLADTKAAVRFIRKNAQKYHLDTENMTIWGESAGGYLALMTALTPKVDELNGDVLDNMSEPSYVRNLVVFYPPVEFYTMREQYRSIGDYEHGKGEFESKYLGVEDIYTNKAACDKAYWRTYIDELPQEFGLNVWVQVGDENDVMIPYPQSRDFAANLRNLNNVDIHFEQIHGARHEDPAFYTDENLGKIFSWIS